MKEVFGFDCYSPKEIAERVENVGVTKANLPLLSHGAVIGSEPLDTTLASNPRALLGKHGGEDPLGNEYERGVRENRIASRRWETGVRGRRDSTPNPN